MTFLFVLSLSASAQVDENRFSEFTQHLPFDNSEVIAINNPVRHVNAFLENKTWQNILDGDAGKKLSEVFGRPIPRISEASDWVNTNQKYFPETIAASGAPETYSLLTDYFEIILRVLFIQQTLIMDDFDQKELSLAQSELADQIANFKIPNAVVWMRWSDQQEGNTLFSTFKKQLASVSVFTRLKVNQSDSHIQISGTIADVVTRPQLEAMINSFGISDSKGEIVDSLLELELFLESTFDDRGLRVVLGEDQSDKAPAQASNMPGLKDGAKEILYGKWRGDHIKLATAQLEKSIERWEQTGLGKSLIDNDTEDIIGSCKTAIDQLRLFSDRGNIRVWQEGNQIRAGVQQFGSKPTAALEKDPILALIPKESESLMVTNLKTFADFTFESISAAEERLSTQSLKAQLSGDTGKEEALSTVIENYYEHFGTFRTFIRDDFAKTEATPFSLLLDSEGNLASMKFNLDGLDSPIEISDDQWVRMAAISKTSDPQELADKMAEVFRRFAKGIAGLSETEMPSEEQLFGTVELGKGIVGRHFLLNWKSETGTPLIEIDGDIQPHTYIQDGHVVFSTSLELSRELISSNETIPSTEITPNVVEYGSFQGKTLGALYRCIFVVAFQAISQQSGNATVNDMGGAMADMITEFCKVMNYGQWTTTQQDERQLTLYKFDFEYK